MIFDYYAALAGSGEGGGLQHGYGLGRGLLERCVADLVGKKDPKENKKEARLRYLNELERTGLPQWLRDLDLDRDCESLPDPRWFWLKVDFTTTSPWYSKDDLPFHILDNPVRMDRVLSLPFMSGTAWKGLLRWACRMQDGLLQHLETAGTEMTGWKDWPWILHLFGNEKGEKDNFRAGSLACYPTWFHKLGFEVINPIRRKTRAGTNPIYYEVVPEETKGTLKLLYAPVHPGTEQPPVAASEFIDRLLASIEALLHDYGFSAKRTSGWGRARIEKWTAIMSGQPPLVDQDAGRFARRMREELHRREP